MSWVAPCFVSRQFAVPGFAFSVRVASLYGGASGGRVAPVVVDGAAVVDGDCRAAAPSSFPPSCHAATVATATTAAPARANRRWRRRRRRRALRRARRDNGGGAASTSD